MRISRWIGVLGTALALTACTAATDNSSDNSQAVEDMSADGTDPGGGEWVDPDNDGATDEAEVWWTVTVALNGLEALSEGEYEGWLVYGDEKVSTGRFSDPATADMISGRDPADADAFVITVEPSNDDDPGPSGVVALSGTISEDGTGAKLGFGADFEDASGGFILRTPTDDGTTSWTLDLSIQGLEDLTEGEYEGWLVVDGEKISTGRFTNGSWISMTTGVDPATADKFVVTIEPGDDEDPAPSGIVVLAGDIGADGKSWLSLPVDLSDASGGFILRTPTDDADNDWPNDQSGVWFLQPGDDGVSAGLNLPELPWGWVYEGWAVTQGVALTTGRFTDPAAADMASPYSVGGPPFPGEDFLMNLPAGIIDPVNLVDGESLIVITVEPDIDGWDPTGDKPFALKPLVFAVPADHPTATFTWLGEGPVVTVTGTLTVTADTPVNNDEAGVWFLSIGDDGPTTGLWLPELPNGFVYEGWAVTQGVPLSTGRFTDPSAADMGSLYSEGGPSFPGEDFLMSLPEAITSPIDLTDGASIIVITVEPDIDGWDPTGDLPFSIKPLATPLEKGHPTATFTVLGAGPQGAPTGMATFAPKQSEAPNGERITEKVEAQHAAPQLPAKAG